MTLRRHSQIETDMSEIIAVRQLRWARKGEQAQSEFTIRIGTPFVVVPGSVNFPVSDGTGACRRCFDGFPIEIDDTIYGADLLQALQLAADVDSTLKLFSDRYDFFFLTGAPYFESGDDPSCANGS